MRALRPVVVAAVLGAACGGVASEPGPPADCGEPVGVRRAVCDARVLVRAAGLRDRPDRHRALAVLGGVAALYAVRHDVRDEILEDRSSDRTRAFQWGRTMGKGAAAPLAAACFLVAWKATGEAGHAETAQLLLESMAGSALAAALGSIALAAERPEDGYRVRPFRLDGHGVSLDVALAASTAGVLAWRPLRPRPGETRARLFWKGAGRGALHAAVLLTALQRMDADKHWAPDVWLGAAAGYGVAGVLVRAHDPEGRPTRAVPALVPARGGTALVWDLSGPR